MAKRWRIHPHDSQRVSAFSQAVGVPHVVAQLLLSRGVDDPKVARTFLSPKLSELRDPELLPGVPAAAERIARAVADGERIVIYGDYDVDGMTGTAILVRCLQVLGGNVRFHIPHRLEEGYGLNDEALERLARDGARLVITVDCGITAVCQAETARRVGLSLIITDHHQFGPTLPDADALVHPQLPGHGYPFSGLCGSGVAFKLAWAVCKRICGTDRVTDRLRSFLLSAVGLAALGTVADVVPLVDENRILVRHGLTSLRDHPTTGLSALLKVAGLDKKRHLDSEDLAFGLAPRLNAAGRFGQGLLGAELLITDSLDRANDLAEYINELNKRRQTLERSIYLAANKQVQEQFDPEGDAALVLAERGWHEGVIGIVAGRIAEKYHRPVVMIALKEEEGQPGVGSARSIPGYDLHAGLTACSGRLVTYGGHKMAAGLRIDPEQVPHFRAELNEHASCEITQEALVAQLFIDGEVPLAGLKLSVIEQLEQMSPFGEANRRPLWCAGGLRLRGKPKKIGGGERHLTLQLEQENLALRAIAFGGADWFDDLVAHADLIDVAFQPVINEYNGMRRVQLQVVDWRPAATPAAVITS